MSHLIPNTDVDRLAQLAGVRDFDEWKRQCDDADARILRLIQGGVRAAWAACFPEWLREGRVADLSRGLRITKYWPSFARQLGIAFAERYGDEFEFLLDVLREHPANSVEALCAYDLLDLCIDVSRSRGVEVPAAVFAAGQEVPPVVCRELGLNPGSAWSVGEVLRLTFHESDGPERSAGDRTESIIGQTPLALDALDADDSSGMRP